MAKQKLPPATDWQARNTVDWNATTYRAYLTEKHEEHYGIPYIARNYAMEAKLIKSMYEEHGKEATRKFIDVCFKDYKPTPKYPGSNFAFMYSCMKGRILPKILADQKQGEKREVRKERREKVDYEKLAELL